MNLPLPNSGSIEALIINYESREFSRNKMKAKRAYICNYRGGGSGNVQIVNSSSNKDYNGEQQDNFHLRDFARKNRSHYSLGSKT